MHKRQLLFVCSGLLLAACQSKRVPEQVKPTLPNAKTVSVLQTHISDSTVCDLRVGWTLASEGEAPGVSSYATIDSSLAYHVFSMDGKELFVSSHFKEQHPLGCDESDSRTSWLLIADTIYDSLQTANLSELYSCLVIGCPGAVNFSTPSQTALTASEMEACLEKLLVKDTIDTTQLAPLHFFPVGAQAGIRRFLVMLNSSDTTIQNVTAVIDIKDGRPEILFKDRRYQNETETRFRGQADRDGDGLSETFAIDFGDYGGKWILRFYKGEWKLLEDYGLSPC